MRVATLNPVGVGDIGTRHPSIPYGDCRSGLELPLNPYGVGIALHVATLNPYGVGDLMASNVKPYGLDVITRCEAA